MFSQKVLIGVGVLIAGLVVAGFLLMDEETQENNSTEINSTETSTEQVSAEENLPKPPEAPSNEQLAANCANYNIPRSQLVDDIGVAPGLVTVYSRENPHEKIFLPFDAKNNFAGCSDAAKELLRSVEYPY